jgi:ADP-ribose pyrophosphatase
MGSFLTIAEFAPGKVYAKKAHPNVVVVVAVTSDSKVIIVEQMRGPVGARAIEFVAGHIGDDPGHEDEAAIDAAKRELMEEAGYTGDVTYLGKGASSPGITDEINHFVFAHNVVKTGKGGGIGDEDITVHEVPITALSDWLFARESEGRVISAKTYAALHMARKTMDILYKVAPKVYVVVGRKVMVSGERYGDSATLITTSSLPLAESAATAAVQSGVWQCIEIKGV